MNEATAKVTATRVRLAVVALTSAAGAVLAAAVALAETLALESVDPPFHHHDAARLAYWLWPPALYGAAGALLGAVAAAIALGIAATRQTPPPRERIEGAALGLLLGLVTPCAFLAVHVGSRSVDRGGGLGIGDAALAALVAVAIAAPASWLLAAIGSRIGRPLRRALQALGAVLVATLTIGSLLQLASARTVERAPQGASAASSTAPNLLLVTIDTLRADALGCYGNTTAETPHLDRLAREGALATHAYTPMVCTDPAHTSILTSQMPRDHRVVRNGVRVKRKGNRTLAEVLLGHGFRTFGAVSVVHLDGTQSALSRGFQRFDDCDPWDAFANHGLFRLRAVLARAAYPTKPLAYERAGEATVTRFVDWLDENDGARFFAWVHLFDPHFPYAPLGSPEEEQIRAVLARVDAATAAHPDGSTVDAGDVERLTRAYAAGVTAADAQLGRMLEALSARGLLDHTVVIAMADHGEHLADRATSPTVWFRHADSTEETARVPLVIRAPGVAPGTRLDLDVSSVDVAPTALDLLGLAPEPLFRGRNLRAALDGDPSAVEPRAIVTNSNPQSPVHSWSVRSQGWELQVRDGESAPALFHATTDPTRSTDRAASEPERVERLREAGERVRVRSRRESAAPAEMPAREEMLRALGYAG